VSPLPTPDAVCGSQHCITCGDVGDPSTVVAVDTDRELALCDGPDGQRSTVEIALVGPVVPGDVLLVHAGTAIARLEDHAVAS
jgi:hydrogenase maturation factor